ncbi:MAG: hypothetical protein CVT67_05025 [Actinobacteria bacterium HGW-Actinobacteria-7]|nr:MAG: hypothetical protein CVT67_05025 [Actinobacteria bacterium HGW-Actinobacteria-7]
MISEAEVKSAARQQGVYPQVVDRDHALGVVLWALSLTSGADGWVFKGGTCLRKCHFGDYRFSEDLDFTLTGRLDSKSALSVILQCISHASSQGIQLIAEDVRVEVMDDDYGRESVEVRLPYRGALRMGSAQNIRFHLSADEELAFEPQSKALLHPYSDAPALACVVRSYALEEVLAEKLRAAAGQRRHAVARDIYDIANLVQRGTDVEAALGALPGKAAHKGLSLDRAAEHFAARRAEFEASWERSLAYLVVEDIGFDQAFSATAELLARA